MNAMVERFRRLDFDSNLTFAQERNGNIQFSGLQVARPPSADFLLSTTSISGATFVLAVGWALIFNHSVLPNLFAIIKTPFFVTILMCLSVMFAGVLWIAVRRVPRFVFDTERREITFKAKLRRSHGFTRERLAPFAQMLHQPKTTGAILAQAETREGAGVLSPGSAEVNRSIATESLQQEIGSYIGHEESTVVKLRR